MSDLHKYLLVFNTCPDKETAKRIAESLVQDKLAACVNIIDGIESYFSWHGKIDSEAECLLIMKTTRDCYLALEKSIQSLHPYELPEIIAIPIEAGLAGYLQWVDENTQTA